jgi:hypothetical protein
MTDILTDAAAVGNATARALVFGPAIPSPSTTRTAPGRPASSAAATSSRPMVCACWMDAHSFSTTPLASRRPWPPRWSVWARSTPAPWSTPRVAPGRRLHLSAPHAKGRAGEGLLVAGALRQPDPVHAADRPAVPQPQQRARRCSERRWLHRHLLSDRVLPKERRATGYRQCRARAGASSFGSTVPSIHGSTRPGNPARLSVSTISRPWPRRVRARHGYRHSVSITTPDRVETRIGTLEFFDGFPTQATVDLVYDNLDFLRGVEAFLSVCPAASLEAMLEGIASVGVDRNGAISITETLLDARALYLTPNTESVYIGGLLDLSNGPVVVESPPNTLGMVNDHFFRYVSDMGNAGPDQGPGGQVPLPAAGLGGRGSRGLLHLPLPDLQEPDVLAGLPGRWRSSTRHRRSQKADQGLPAGRDGRRCRHEVRQHLRAIPQHDPRQRHPLLRRGPGRDRRGARRCLQPRDPRPAGGDRNREGKPFSPDARMRGILEEAAAVANATARAISFRTRDSRAYYYEDSAWFTAFVGGSHEFLRESGARDLDARTMFHYGYTAVTPAMVVKIVGVGSQYASPPWMPTATTLTVRRPIR